MIQTWLATIISVLTVSLISLIGLLTLTVKPEQLKKALLALVSLAAGALLADAFIHLLPEVIKTTDQIFSVAIFILIGIFIFFFLEKVIRWRHCHEPDCYEHNKALAPLNLIGDGVHNFLDGVIIAGGFLASFPLGLATTLAVIFHEIPQEIGDFGILIHGGYSRKKALIFNFVSALFAVVGAVLTLMIGARIDTLGQYLIPITIGGFIYIANSDLIPEIHKETNLKKSLIQLLAFLAGIGIMFLLLLVE